MTFEQFSEIFALLAVQLREHEADEMTMRGYFAALKDLEPEFVSMAAMKIAKTADWFPKTSEWRTAALVLEAKRVTEQRHAMQRMPQPLCAACDDTGWMRGDDNRVRRCPCVEDRREELLGRRLMPKLS